MAVALVGLALLGGCGGSGSGSGGAAASAPTTQERIEQHLKQAGEEIKAAATEASAEAKPAIDKAKVATEDALHGAAQKVSEMTTTSSQPASRP